MCQTLLQIFILIIVVRTKIPLISISFLSPVLTFVLVAVLLPIIQNVFVIDFVIDEKNTDRQCS